MSSQIVRGPGYSVSPVSNSTGAKGLPLAKIARPSLHRYACSGVHSARDEGQQLLGMLDEGSVEQPLIPSLQRKQRDVPLDVVLLASQVFEHPRKLHVLPADRRRQKAAQSMTLTLFLCESGRLVVPGIIEQGLTEWFGNLSHGLRCPMVLEVIADTHGQMFALDARPNGHRAILAKVKLVITRALTSFELLVESVPAHVHACLHQMAI